jgi:hypothetical protein
MSHFSKYYKEITEKLAESKNLKSEIKSSIIDSIDGMKKIVKELSEIIKKNEFVLLTNIESQNCKQLDAIIDIKCELNNIKSIVSNKSYSSALKFGSNSAKFTSIVENQSENVVIIRPKKDNIKPSESESIIKNVINKSDMSVDRIKYLSKGGLAINCRNIEDKECLIKIVNSKIKDFEANAPILKAPQIAIYGVEEDIDIDNIVDNIVSKNQSISDFIDSTGTTTEDNIKVKFKFRRNQNKRSNTWVIEVSPKMRQIINSLRTLNIGWRSYRYADYVQITRCFNCNGFGHISANCVKNEKSCGICGHNHDTKDCNASNESKFCVNCDKINKRNNNQKVRTDHTVFSPNCEALKRVQNIAKSRINYG